MAAMLTARSCMAFGTATAAEAPAAMPNPLRNSRRFSLRIATPPWSFRVRPVSHRSTIGIAAFCTPELSWPHKKPWTGVSLALVNSAETASVARLLSGNGRSDDGSGIR